jgi:hypothetical protein
MIGKIPGKANVKGDSEKNDTVQINVSPGEIVIPRTVVQKGPSAILKFAREALEKDQKNFSEGGKVKEQSVWDKFATAFDEEKPKKKTPVPGLDREKAKSFSSVFNADYAKGGIVEEEFEDVTEQYKQQDEEFEDVTHEFIKPKPAPQEVMSAVQGAGDSLLLGHAPHFQAGVDVATAKLLEQASKYDWLADKLGIPKDVELDTNYIDARDENIKRQEALKAENPKAYLAGGVAGTILGAGAAGIAGRAATMVPKATTVGQRIAQSTAQGATLGALQNPGDVEGETNGLQIAERVPNILMGTALGAGTSGAIEAGSAIAKKSGDFFKKLANEKAVKSAGARKKDLEMLGPDQKKFQSESKNNKSHLLASFKESYRKPMKWD